MSTNILHKEERHFFTLLAELIFSNPFSIERSTITSMFGIVIDQHNESYQHTHHYNAVIPTLKAMLLQLSERGIYGINDIATDDKQRLEYALLFLLYHEYTDEFDQLINAQAEQHNTPLNVSFAKTLLNQLHRYGFTEQEALRYFALFYQFRRAYFFIHKALIGDASCMRELRHALWNNIFTADVRLYANHLWNRMEDFSTLLLGDTGTGKGSAAAAIGRSGLIPFDVYSNRFSENFTDAFVSINLLEYSENLIESELFGHRKGAFTGAIDHYKGLFERCSPHGSLLLDEIGDVSIPIQIKLLNVLQQRRFKPVGSHEHKRFHGRVIAATNRDLTQLRHADEFRDDFFYRLSSDVIQMPTLQQRIEQSPQELEQLIESLVTRMTQATNPALVDQIVSTLEKNLPANYHWPGNVRELEQAVRHIILNNHYRINARPPQPNHWIEQLQQGQFNAQELMAHYCQLLYQQHGTYEQVAKITALDRRTVKKYIDSAK